MSNPVAYTCRQWLDGHPGGLIVRMPHPSFTEPLYDQAGLDAAVAAERERWRAWAGYRVKEAMSKVLRSTDPQAMGELLAYERVVAELGRV